jgi:NADPH-dependent 2,4-dienoyl-CoA reductase/sulfur reductase-like enzyme
MVGDTVRCPLHHACFSLRTGEALRAPALNPIATWDVEARDGKVFVLRERDAADGATPTAAVGARSASAKKSPASIVIVGGGAAGNAAAEMLRRNGYDGRLTMITADESLPYDRPNLSKDYLAGSAPEDWIPLRPPDFYNQHRIEVVSRTQARSLDIQRREVITDAGSRVAFDRLLLATGAEPIRLTLPGADSPHVHYLRTLADARALIARASTAKAAVVIGASFIGLEVAASLRARGLAVHVIAPEDQPLVKVMGPELGAYIRRKHEENGVVFHLGTTVASIGAAQVTLASGGTVSADLVAVGIGVRPALALAESAGARIDRGVLVDEHLETNIPGVFAAGDIARWPDVHSGERIRVEHWVVAERQGQTAARNMLADGATAARERFDAVPFFWSAHYDAVIRYVGHAERWESTEIDGDISAADAKVSFQSARGRTLAVATLNRDVESLRAELALERAP